MLQAVWFGGLLILSPRIVYLATQTSKQIKYRFYTSDGEFYKFKKKTAKL